MNKIDVDDLIRRNVEKMNKKRARKGLPPANVSEKASVNLKARQAREDAESKAKEDKISRNKKQMEASEAFYNSDPKPGSLASKAKTVSYTHLLVLLMKRFNSIKKNSEFQKVYKTGQSYANKLLVMYVKRVDDGKEPRIGISVSKKVGNSVVRHHVTRWVRES